MRREEGDATGGWPGRTAAEGEEQEEEGGGMKRTLSDSGKGLGGGVAGPMLLHSLGKVHQYLRETRVARRRGERGGVGGGPRASQHDIRTVYEEDEEEGEEGRRGPSIEITS